ncbi:MAG: CocE/NonD family hydrolase, partial [Gemmatimonadota bacterium]|nr:CocE/NonD family hydrolase [Gemmatimonadota bacterium]
VQKGYAYVVGDTRGRYDSEGDFYPYRHDGTDGSAIMNWIVQQPWSNSRVATIGGSYLGKNQWMMAKENNPHHAAIVSYVAPADDFHDGTRYNGVPKLDLMYTWSMMMDGRVNQTRNGWNWGQIMRGLPLHTLDEKAGRSVSFWREQMEHSNLDDFWTPVQMTGFYERFDIPSFSVTGWYEGQLKGQVQNHVEAVRTSRSPEAHMLVIGPWLHGVNRNRVIGERDAGPTAIIDLDRVRDAWLDHQMLNAPRPEYARFLYFLPVKNEWQAATAYPIPGTEFRPYYLDSQGRANALLGNGVLRAGRPGSGRADEYTYDPRNPVPSQSSRTSGARGGLPQGSVDNRAVETREDVLVYTSEPLAEAMEITGPVKAVIYLSTDVPDTDVTVKLLDVYPDGRAHNLSEGIARAKYRTSYSQPEPLEAGKVYGLEVELFPTSNYFEAGHRIRIEVSSSDFPNFARNLNTMDSDTGTETRVARTRIHHTRAYPSHIVLPIVPATATQPWNP